MGEAALALEATEEKPQVCLTLVESKSQKSARSNSFLTFLVIGLIIIQILDGVLTAYGVTLLGHTAEGNPLLRGLMVHFGTIPTLIVAKGICIAIVCFLGYYAGKVSWLERAMTAVACLYILAAIVPWTLILTSKVLLA